MKRKILCVDDEDVVRRLLAHILSAKGHAVSTASDGVEALACATSTPFDVVITDHQMPRMTGLELVGGLRADGYQGKVIVFSGALSPEIKKKFEALGVDLIAAKPLGTTDILTFLEAR